MNQQLKRKLGRGKGGEGGGGGDRGKTVTKTSEFQEPQIGNRICTDFVFRATPTNKCTKGAAPMLNIWATIHKMGKYQCIEQATKEFHEN